MADRGPGVVIRPVTGAGTVRTLAGLVLVLAGSAVALCPTPETLSSSRATLLGADDHRSELPWDAAPEGSVARYHCDLGFVLVGEAERTCQADDNWSGAAPRCLLNIADQTSLLARRELVDSNLSTHVPLSQLEEEDVELYDVTPPDSAHAQTLPVIREIRIITSGQRDLDGWQIIVSKPSEPCDSTEPSSVNVEVQKNTQLEYSIGTNKYAEHTYLTKACFKTILIRKSGSIRRVDSSSPSPSVYEIQLISEETGVSHQQCRTPVGSGSPPTVSWAVGDLCYHLFAQRLSHDAAADRCNQLDTEGGRLMQLRSNGVHSVTRHVLRHLSNAWSNEFIWIGGGEGSYTDEQTDSSEESIDNTETSSSPAKRICQGVRQILQWHLAELSCDDERMFICETAPFTCGSPAVGSGQRYSPLPAPTLRASNVTCAGESVPTGTVFCRRGHWTPADFCDTDGVLALVLGAVAGFVLLLGCVLLATVSYMKHKRDNENGWETYTYIRRLSRLSRYGGRQNVDLAANLMADNTYSETNRSRSAPRSVPGRRSPRESWLYGPPAGRRADQELPPPPPPSTSPPSSAGLVNPGHRVPSPTDESPPPPSAGSAHIAVEYCVPLVQGQRQSPKLSFADRPTDGAAGGEYAVPYDARRQASAGNVGEPPDVVTSTGGK